MARMLDYEVVVCEPRRRFAAATISADKVDGSWPNACIEKLAAAGRLGAGSVIIVCTHDRKFDEPALLAAVRSSAGFIGALGSRRTREDRRVRLLAAGLSESEVSRIRSPVGIDLGSETPAETAVSIFAETIAARRGGSGRPLTELSGAIHGRHVELCVNGS
ncbi:MAG: XdhC family protein [Terrimicrobiaceae bacterium]